MKRTLVAGGALALAATALAAVPASATHGTQQPAAVVIAIGGTGNVCSAANSTQWNSLWGSNPTSNAPQPIQMSCSYYTDPIWAQTGDPNFTPSQGLYFPRNGPPASAGGFTFVATGGTVAADQSYCVDTYEGANCTIRSAGSLYPGNPTGFGIYCGSSRGYGRSQYTSAGQTLLTTTTFNWQQSAATVLPIIGTVSNGATTIGFTSSSGTGVASDGNCSRNTPTTGFRVHGLFVTF